MSEKMGQCAELTLGLAEKDPTLTRVRGYYLCPIWGPREHWWLKTQDGIILDPTKEQFPSRGLGEYQEWDEGSPEPTGICMGCGGYTFNGEYTCSATCEALVMEDY